MIATKITKSQYDDLKNSYLAKNRSMHSLYIEIYEKANVDKHSFFRLINRIREVIARAADDLENLDVMHEKKLVQRFIQELRKDKGLCSYGEKQVRNNLIMGAVDTLLLSEDLASMRKKFTCPNCGYENSEGMKFCNECGAKLGVQKTFCTSCGAELQGGARFCGECGARQE